jgi:uncharacterized membrane protein YgcG
MQATALPEAGPDPILNAVNRLENQVRQEFAAWNGGFSTTVYDILVAYTKETLIRLGVIDQTSQLSPLLIKFVRKLWDAMQDKTFANSVTENGLNMYGFLNRGAGRQRAEKSTKEVIELRRAVLSAILDALKRRDTSASRTSGGSSSGAGGAGGAGGGSSGGGGGSGIEGSWRRSGSSSNRPTASTNMRKNRGNTTRRALAAAKLANMEAAKAEEEEFAKRTAIEASRSKAAITAFMTQRSAASAVLTRQDQAAIQEIRTFLADPYWLRPNPTTAERDAVAAAIIAPGARVVAPIPAKGFSGSTEEQIREYFRLIRTNPLEMRRLNRSVIDTPGFYAAYIKALSRPYASLGGSRDTPRTLLVRLVTTAINALIAEEQEEAMEPFLTKKPVPTDARKNTGWNVVGPDKKRGKAAAVFDRLHRKKGGSNPSEAKKRPGPRGGGGGRGGAAGGAGGGGSERKSRKNYSAPSRTRSSRITSNSTRKNVSRRFTRKNRY